MVFFVPLPHLSVDPGQLGGSTGGKFLLLSKAMEKFDY